MPSRSASKSPSNYPGLSFAVRWHDPGAHAGLANCERKQAELATASSSLLSWLITPLPTSENRPHLTRRGTWANWEQLGSSEPRAECRKGTDVAHPSGKLNIYSQFGNDCLSRHMGCSRLHLNPYPTYFLLLLWQCSLTHSPTHASPP